MQEKKYTTEISVVIPVLNGLSDHLAQTLSMICKQKIDQSFEIIIIDSGSTDGTIKFLKKRNDIKLHQILNSEFGHGKTRQMGAELAQGKYVIFITQDATPFDENWLNALVQNFSDSEVVGVCSRIVFRKDANLLRKIQIDNDLCGRKNKISARVNNGHEFF
jgi:rhamnosyltransferase